MEAVRRLLTVEEVASTLQVTTRSVFKWICANKIRAVKLGKRCTRVRTEELDRFIREHETQEEEN